MDNRLFYKIRHFVSHEVSLGKHQVDYRGRAGTFYPILTGKLFCTLLKYLSVNKGSWSKLSDLGRNKKWKS